MCHSSSYRPGDTALREPDLSWGFFIGETKLAVGWFSSTPPHREDPLHADVATAQEGYGLSRTWLVLQDIPLAKAFN